MASFRGFPCSSELAEWLTWYERVLLCKGVIKHSLDVFQLQGTYSKSGNTHVDGYAYDIGQYDAVSLDVADQMGAFSWHRTPAQGFINHQHGGLYGIAHENAALAGQGRDRRNGWNGLVGKFRARDPRPVSGRDWRQGIEWAKAQVGNVPPSDPFTYRHVEWNVESERYGRPWAPRGEQIGALIAAEKPDVVTVQETWDSAQTATLLRHLDGFAHVSSPNAGIDIFYRSAVFAQTRPAVEYSMKVQGRAAHVLHLQHRPTSRPLTIVNTHAPALVPAYRTVFARNLVRLLGQVDGPIVLAGDFNNASRAKSPHKELAAAGFVAAKVQAELTNETEAEYPKKAQWLADVLTKPRDAQVIGGELVRTPARLSDHRMISLQVRA